MRSEKCCFAKPVIQNISHVTGSFLTIILPKMLQTNNYLVNIYSITLF